MQRPLVSFAEAKGSPVAFWLMACYAYEELDQPLMDDATFDELVLHMEDNWLDLNHPHLYLLNPALLKSSIGARKPRIEWPTRIFCATHQLMDQIHGVGKWGDAGESFLKKMAQEHIANVEAKAKPVPGADLV